jgi:hypothetical protein
VGGDRFIWGGEERQLVVEAHQAAAGVDGIRRGGPVVQFLFHVGHDVGHLGLGVLRRPHMVGGHHRLGDVGVEHMHAQRQQEGRAVLQRRLHQVADEGTHLPEREAFREALDRVEAGLQHVGARFLPQGEAARVRVLDGVEVHDLVAQLAPVVVVKVRSVGLRNAIRVGEEGAPVDQVGGVADTVREGGRAQRRGHRVAQRHQFVAPVEIFGIAREGDGEHQAKVPDRVMEARRERGLRALQQVADALAGELPEQVAVAGRAAPSFGLFGLGRVLDPQVGIAAQGLAHLGRGEKVELDAGAGRAVGVERDQDFRHALVGAGLGHEFQQETHAVAVHENLLGGEVGGVGQPVCELLGWRLHGPAEGEARCLGAAAGCSSVEMRGAHGVLTVRGWRRVR